MDPLVLRIPAQDGTLNEIQVEKSSAVFHAIKRYIADIDLDLLSNGDNIGLFQDNVRIAMITPDGALRIDNTGKVYKMINTDGILNSIQQIVFDVPDYGQILVCGDAETKISIIPNIGRFHIGSPVHFTACCEKPTKNPKKIIFGTFYSNRSFRDLKESSLTRNARAAIDVVVMPWLTSVEGQTMLVHNAEKVLRHKAMMADNQSIEASLEVWRIRAHVGILERRAQEYADQGVALTEVPVQAPPPTQRSAPSP